MPNYINIGGKLHVNTKEYGYVTLQDYMAIRALTALETKEEAPQTINANTMLISNKNPQYLSKDEVLDVFVQYIHKYRHTSTKFDIPVGSKYQEYSDYIYSELRRAFPEIQWKLLYVNDTQFVVRGEAL